MRNRRNSLGQFLSAPARTHRLCKRCDVVREVAMFSNKRGMCKRCIAKIRSENIRTPNGRYHQARHIAKRRSIKWNIEQEDYYRLRVQPCHYCGFSLSETGIGLDRVDSSLAYTLDNVVPCCSDCNRAKGASFTYAEMLIIGKVIASVKAARQDDEPRGSHYRPRTPEEPLSAPAPPQPPSLFD